MGREKPIHILGLLTCLHGVNERFWWSAMEATVFPVHAVRMDLIICHLPDNVTRVVLIFWSGCWWPEAGDDYWGLKVYVPVVLFGPIHMWWMPLEPGLGHLWSKESGYFPEPSWKLTVMFMFLHSTLLMQLMKTNNEKAS
jgi:hypothetical protein